MKDTHRKGIQRRCCDDEGSYWRDVAIGQGMLASLRNWNR